MFEKAARSSTAAIEHVDDEGNTFQFLHSLLFLVLVYTAGQHGRPLAELMLMFESFFYYSTALK